MSKRRKGRPGGPPRQAERPIGLREVAPGVFELVPPRVVEELYDDYEEAMELLREGEVESARDALRHALSGSGYFLEVHAALGKIALDDDRDPTLARGHYGYVVELGERALPPGFRGKLSERCSVNRAFLESIAALARIYKGMGQRSMAERLLERMDRLAAGSGGKPGASGAES